jgi:hypothetical protein
MFDLNIDDRLSAWAQFRKDLETADCPFDDAWNFWKDAPFIPYNNAVDPYFQFGWPTPWDIIVHNKYDDFTKALMIGWTLKLTKRFENNLIEIRTLVDKESLISYNIICVDNGWAINYNDKGPLPLENIPDRFNIENLVELSRLR